jgi:hypothetical protein
MKLQYLCHMPTVFVLAVTIGFMGACGAAGPAFSDTPGTATEATTAPAHDYPTVARVEYVNPVSMFLCHRPHCERAELR